MKRITCSWPVTDAGEHPPDACDLVKHIYREEEASASKPQRSALRSPTEQMCRGTNAAHAKSFRVSRLWWSDPYKLLWEAHHANGAFLQQAEFSGFQGRLRPVAHPQLAQDVAEVILDGAAGDVEGLADLAIGSPTRQQGQDLPFALGQLRHVAHTDERRSGGSDHCGLDGCRREGGKDFVCNIGMQEDLPLCDHANGRSELLGGDVFEHIAPGSRLQTRLDQLSIVEGRQDNHADLGPALFEGTRRANA